MIRLRTFAFLCCWLVQPSAFLSLASDPESASPAETITWTTGTGKWKGQWGRRELLLCPPGGELEPIWGTDAYTDDSPICTAAVHAGLISQAGGGQVTIEVRPDHSPYHASTRNGVRSRDWMDPWPGSFTFIWGPALAAPAPAVRATATLQAESWLGKVGRIVTLLCPPKLELHTVYGTDIYAGDSYICSAAVHAGKITQVSGGMVTIKLLEGQSTYAGSTRNGVTSMSNGAFPGSFSFVATAPNTPPPPTEDTPPLPAPVHPFIAPPTRTQDGV